MPPDWIEFFNDAVTLVPVPRSSLTVAGGVWPPLTIAEVILDHGLAGGMLPCLKRKKTVQRSSTAGKGKRPTAARHYATMTAKRDLIVPERILLVDDVVTKGATLIGAASRVQQVFPDSEVRVFALMRTQGFTDIAKTIEPVRGTIRCYKSGKVWRVP